MTQIDVRQTGSDDPLEFTVTVSEGPGSTRHHVSMRQATYEQLTAGRVTPVACVRAAFAFLLDREPKESILSRFDVTVISRYFPSFEREIAEYLSSA